MVKPRPRGIRNNNPGNIRWDGTTQWRGMVGQDAGGFVIFDTPENGIRAMARILGNYQRIGVDTITAIISRWAPDTENDTIAYIRAVETRTGIDRNMPISGADYPAIIGAIIRHENGSQPYTVAQINTGVALA
jgi:hypothetical protein